MQARAARRCGRQALARQASQRFPGCLCWTPPAASSAELCLGQSFASWAWLAQGWGSCCMVLNEIPRLRGAQAVADMTLLVGLVQVAFVVVPDTTEGQLLAPAQLQAACPRPADCSASTATYATASIRGSAAVGGPMTSDTLLAMDRGQAVDATAAATLRDCTLRACSVDSETLSKLRLGRLSDFTQSLSFGPMAKAVSRTGSRFAWIL